MVYDDSLTHIGIFEIKETLNADKESEESFAIQSTDAPEYFETNGLPKIGTYFGGRDHSTIMSSYRKIESDLKTNEQLKIVIKELKQMLST